MPGPTFPILILEFILKNVNLCFMSIIYQKEKRMLSFLLKTIQSTDQKLGIWMGSNNILFCFLVLISLGEKQQDN